MMEMDEISTRFVQRLALRNLQVPDGVVIEKIREFEARYCVQLPIDMVEFFLRVDGMMPGELDPENQIRISSLDEIRSLSTELPEYSLTVEDADRAFVVGDFLLWSFGYATWLSSTSVVSSPVFLVGDGPPIRIAATFAEFLLMYVDNSSGLVPRKRDCQAPHRG